MSTTMASRSCGKADGGIASGDGTVLTTMSDYAARVQALAESDIVVNTVPSPDAIPPSAFPQLRDAIVVDIASPPGGTDYAAAGVSGIDLTWARGLAGARAPLSAGDAQLRFITDAIRGSGPRRHTAGASPASPAKRA